MDAVELARQRAAALHDEVVSKGADPWDPEALVRAVASSLELDIEPVEPDSAILNGGRAQFDPINRAIRHEDSGTTFFKAFLVGHELGHATLGDDRIEHVAHDVNPMRPAEAAPSARIGSSITAADSAARCRWTCLVASSCYRANGHEHSTLGPDGVGDCNEAGGALRRRRATASRRAAASGSRAGTPGR